MIPSAQVCATGAVRGAKAPASQQSAKSLRETPRGMCQPRRHSTSEDANPTRESCWWRMPVSSYVTPGRASRTSHRKPPRPFGAEGLPSPPRPVRFSPFASRAGLGCWLCFGRPGLQLHHGQRKLCEKRRGADANLGATPQVKARTLQGSRAGGECQRPPTLSQGGPVGLHTGSHHGLSALKVFRPHRGQFASGAQVCATGAARRAKTPVFITVSEIFARNTEGHVPTSSPLHK